MKKMKCTIVAIAMLMCSAHAAVAGVSIGIGLPTLSIGINLPLYPDLVPVPGYPVYYAPGVSGNYFFYDGMYWVYQNDNWYASSWYNGPWGFVEPMSVPLYVLRVPVSYYRQPPVYFRGWQSNAPPRWGEHWGRSWEERRGGWDHWQHNSVPARAPLPAYQRKYAGDKYPRGEQQNALRGQQYRYQPRDKIVRQHLTQIQHGQPAAKPGRQEKPQAGREQDRRRQPSQQQGTQPGGRAQPAAHDQRQQPAARDPRQQTAPREQKQQPSAREQQPGAQRGQHPPQAQQPQQNQQRGHEQQRGQEKKPQDNGGAKRQEGGHGQDGGQGQGHNKEEGRGR